MMNIATKFQNPNLLWLLLVLIPMIVWYIWKRDDQKAKLKISTLIPFEHFKKDFFYQIRDILAIIRFIIIALLIIAMARPIKTVSKATETTKGIDIILAIDISTSMLTEDFKPNRLEVAKKVATEFINNRPNDRIGIVAFAGESFTVCPLTTDHTTLINLLNQLQTGYIEDGTAIGLGLANAVARLYKSKAKSKVIILLTDGVNNTGSISPIDAAQMAKNYGIRVYTIAIGTKQGAIVMGNQIVETEVDVDVLKKIANITSARFFMATDENKLREIYNEIDKMEKTLFEKTSFVRTIIFVQPFLWAIFLLLLIEILLRTTIYRTIP